MSVKVGIEKCLLRDESTIYMEKDGKKRYIHSKYDPIVEAKKWATEIKKDEVATYIIFGGGLFYHIYELLNMIDTYSKIIVLEPNKDVFYFAQFNDTYINSVKDARVSVLFYEDEDTLPDIISKILDRVNAKNINFHIYRYYELYYPQLVKGMLKGINDYILIEEISYNTNEIFITEHMRNVFSNIYQMRKSTFAMSFANKFEGKTAIIVSAGPSLDKNVDLLKGNEDKFIIISSGRTLKTLLDRKIKPHFVVTLDPSNNNYKLIEDVCDSDVPMLNSMLTNREIPKNYKGEKIFLNNSGIGNIDNFLFGEHIDTLSVSGTVASMQLNFAQYLGCKKIVFIGQDLAYTDNKAHAESTLLLEHEKGKANDVDVDNRHDFIKVKGNTEETVYTDDIFYSFLLALQSYIEGFEGVEVYNCTEGGAYIKGTTVMAFKEFIEKKCDNSDNFYEKIHDIIKQNKRNYSLEYINDKMKEMEIVSNDIIKLTNQGLSIINKNIKNKFETQKDLDKMKKIDKKLSKLTEKFDFSSMIAEDILKIFENINFDDDVKNDEQKEYIRKVSRAYYVSLQGMYKFIDYFVKEQVKEHKNEINKKENI